jgi:hypothetical protein
VVYCQLKCYTMHDHACVHVCMCVCVCVCVKREGVGEEGKKGK